LSEKKNNIQNTNKKCEKIKNKLLLFSIKIKRTKNKGGDENKIKIFMRINCF